MATRIPPSPRSRPIRNLKARKSPSQGRAEATVEAILAATAHILKTEGWEAVNTNRVAAGAGVSIGSLYQYFPGRDAILAELGRRHALQIVEATRGALESTEERSLTEAVTETIRAAIRVHDVDPALHRAIEDETPNLGPLDWRETADADTHRILCEALSRRRTEMGDQDIEFVAFLAATVVESVVHSAMIARPDDLRNGRIEAELVDVVLGILTRARAAKRRQTLR
jgi:AcrR family transcriptional regulator